MTKSFEQRDAAKLRKAERARKKQEAFESYRKSIQLTVEYWKMAQVGFWLFWLTALAVMVIFILREVFG